MAKTYDDYIKSKEHVQTKIASRGKEFEVDVGVEELVKSINGFQFGKDKYPFDTVNSCQERPDTKETWVQLKTHYPQLLSIILNEAQSNTHCGIKSNCSSNKDLDNKTECNIFIDCNINKMNILALDKIAREIKRFSC